MRFGKVFKETISVSTLRHRFFKIDDIKKKYPFGDIMRCLIIFLFLYSSLMQVQGLEELEDLDVITAVPFGLKSKPTPVADDSVDMSVIDLEGEPNAIVNNCVNAITGTFLDSETDLVVPGARPITIQRSYSSSNENRWGGWSSNFTATLFLSRMGDRYTIDSFEGSGVHLLYTTVVTEGKLPPFRLVNRYIESGLTNCGSGTISGRTNRKNTRIQTMGRISSEKNKWEMRLGSGSRRIYQLHGEEKDHLLFTIEEEIDPNGNRLYYNFYKQLNVLNIKATNSQLDDFASVQVKYPWEYKEQSQVDFHSSDGRNLTYHYEKIDGENYLKKVVRPDSPEEMYKYTESAIDKHKQLLAQKILPNKRSLKVEYYVRGENKIGERVATLEKYDPRLDRVKHIKAPVGADSTPVITHSFSYSMYYDQETGEIERGGATVFDANDSTSFAYIYDRYFHLRAIRKVMNEKLYRTDWLFWGKEKNAGNLVSRILKEKDKIHFCRYLQYDKMGNILEEQLWGNLTGRNQVFPDIENDGTPKNEGCEVYKKNYEYSKDGFNLPVMEDDGRKKIFTGYVPNTDLVQHRFTDDKERRWLREFYEYDANAVLIKKIVDDGSTDEKDNLSGVSERHITYTTPSKEKPIGLPEITEEKYLDLSSLQEILLKKVVNTYSKEGYLIQQDHYDNKALFAFSLFWAYDQHGNVIEEINALGECTKRKFDENNNLIYEKGPSNDFHKEYTYDYANRLIREEEIHVSGNRFVTTHKYNLLSQRIATVDIYGNETNYVYDDCGRLIKTIYPKVSKENGEFYNPTTTTDYNVLDQPISKTDANGNVTTQNFTIRGKMCQITYPDGSSESRQYTLDGLLEHTIAKNGLKTVYEYDSLGRVIGQNKYAASGKLLTHTSSHYNAFHLEYEIDEVGYTTYYKYDPAGRLSAVTKGQRKTEYTYDPLGRLERTSEYFQNDDFCATIRKYDNLERIIEERIEDKTGNVLKQERYAYDSDGNQTQVICFTQAGESITNTTYNIFKQPECITDALGKKTSTVYRYDYAIEIGSTKGDPKKGIAPQKLTMRVPYQETTDPLGNITITISDSNGRITKNSRKDPSGNLVQMQEFYYDANGNRKVQVETIYTPNAPERKVRTEWKYDTMNRVAEILEAAGTPEQKCTKFVYNLIGEKEKVIKNSGTTLQYEYDALGRLENFRASDGSFNYHYE